MSDYLNKVDSSDEEVEAPVCTLQDFEIADIRANCANLKAEGNAFFSDKDYNSALGKYTEIIKLLKEANLPPDDIILCNRSATYLALKRYVPASFDAQQAAKTNPDNWKAHWRNGIAILHMAKKKFRSKQAMVAFEGCLRCSTLPDHKRQEITQELERAKARLEQQDAETPMPDMSNCAPS